MSDPKNQLGKKKEEGIIALLTYRTTEEAARAIKVSPKTLLRWQKEPAFEEAWRDARRTTFGQALGRLHQLAGAAVSTLGKVMMDPATPPATKARTAEIILSQTARAIEMEDIEVRLKDLERATEESTRKR